ncbi:patatin-like phospholipase family protein [Comamonas humi]
MADVAAGIGGVAPLVPPGKRKQSFPPLSKGPDENTAPLSLALQGGGSHGAYTWGVLDALLENRSLWVEAISGTSAGAMNAVVFAYGYGKGASEHTDRAKGHEAGCALARELLKKFWEGVGALGSLFFGAPLQNNPMLSMMAQWLSPYQTNPLDINPLRGLLEKVVDFEFLQKEQGKHAPKVFVCATNVRTGSADVFSGARLTADAVMASACLPMLFKAVNIDGENYWDGGYSGNPLIYPLIYHTGNHDVLLVQLNPAEYHGLPDSAQDILDRMSEITFNASLLAELRAIAFVRRLLEQGRLDPALYKNMLIHHIDGGRELQSYGASSKSKANMSFVLELFDKGQSSGQRWLERHRKDVGVRSELHDA